MKSVRLLVTYLKFVHPYSPLIRTTIFLVIVWTVINFIPPWLVKVLIDEALPNQDKGLLAIIVGAQLFHIVNFQFMSSMKGFLFTYLEQRVNLDMNGALFDHLMTLPVHFFNTNEAGALVHRFMQDVTQIKELVHRVIIDIIVHSVMLCMLIVIMLYINLKLALVCLTIAVIYGINANVFKNRIYGTARDIGERTGELYALLYQILPGIREIKGLQLAKYMRRVYAKAVVKFFRANMRNYRLGVYAGLIAGFLPPLAWTVVIGMGGLEVIKGTLSIGSLLAFASYLEKIYAPINGLSGLYSDIQKIVPAMERVTKVMETQPEFNTFKGHRLVLTDVKGHMQLRSVMFGYLKDRPVEKNINMDISPGRKVALVGPSGCGKTTLAHLIMRFYDVSAGSIHLDGINIKQINLPSYRRHVGMIPQGIKLFAASIRENILMGKRFASEDQIVAAAKAANAHDFIANLPDGYDTLYGEKGVWLSGGETQRIVIARAILQDPRVLILDEATSSVDANSEALIQDAINRLSVDRTLVVIAHRFSAIMDADWIYVMDAGSVVAQGTHSSLLKENELYAGLYRRQVLEGAVEKVAYAN